MRSYVSRFLPIAFAGLGLLAAGCGEKPTEYGGIKRAVNRDGSATYSMPGISCTFSRDDINNLVSGYMRTESGEHRYARGITGPSIAKFFDTECGALKLEENKTRKAAQ